MSFLKNIIVLLISAQEKYLARKKTSIANKALQKRKKLFKDGCVLTLDSLAESELQRMEDELSLILKSANYEPEEILKYIKSHSTEIYYLKNTKPLSYIREMDGFIYPQKGLRAVYISLLTQRKIQFKTNEMFILPEGELNKYYFIYHLYNWYAYKHGITAIDTESKLLIEKLLLNQSKENIASLKLEEIMKLQDAIKQDKASIDFVLKLCKQFDCSKKALEKIKNEGANI